MTSRKLNLRYSKFIHYFYLYLNKNITAQVNTTKVNKYIFNVNEYVSARKPIPAGKIIVEDNPIVIRLVTVIGILSFDCLTACRIIIGTKFAIANP